jgi:hypothetical protein
MGFILDSESYGDCLISLAEGFQCTAADLEQSLKGLTNDDIFGNTDECIDYGTYLLEFVSESFAEPLSLEAVYWFHATRTLESNSFEDGLLNLDDAKSSVWNILIESAPSEEIALKLENMQEEGGFDNMYHLRTEDSMHWGPYGALVKELVVDVGETAQRDYLELPEMIEDICNGYEQKFNESLHSHYSDQLVPKIIKFISTCRVDDGCLKAALAYLHSSIHDDHIGNGAITCFDSDGMNISAEDIIYVETVSL